MQSNFYTPDLQPTSAGSSGRLRKLFRPRPRPRFFLVSMTRTLFVCGCAAWCAFVLSLSAQTNATTKVKDFRVPEYYDPPHEGQMKSLLQGAEAEPASEGRILITSVKLKRFSENGELQVLVEAPHCVFDSVRREVSSPGPLRVRSADGKMDLQGEGFLWQQTNSNLVISNRVRTVILNAQEKSAVP
jgi:hypothetical protein